MAIANLVVLFTQFFVRMGLASALVQKPDLSEEEIRAASTAGIAIGLACLVLIWILAPAVAALFRAPDLPPVLRASGRVVRVHGLVHDGTGPAAPRAPLPHPVDDLGGHVRVRLPRRGRGPGPARGRRVEPGGGVGGVHGDPGDLAVRHRPASAPARAPLGAVPGGLRLRGAPVGRLPDGLRRQQPRHLDGQPYGEHRGARPVHPGVLPGLPAAQQLPGPGADECAVLDPQPHPAGPGPPAPCLLQRLVAREPDAVPDLRRHRGGGARAGPGRARPAVGPGGRAGPVVRCSRVAVMSSPSSRSCWRTRARS